MLNMNIFKQKTTTKEDKKNPEVSSEVSLAETEAPFIETLNAKVEKDLAVMLKEYFDRLAEEKEGVKLEDSQPSDVRLEILNELLSEKEMTPEIAEKLINTELGLNISELLDEEIRDPEVKEPHEDVASRVKSIMSQKTSNEKTILEVVRGGFESKIARIAFVTAILFLKFNPGHAAIKTAEKDGLTKNKITYETKKPVIYDGDDGKGEKYDASSNFTKAKTIKLEADSHFDNDKADLKNASELAGEFDNFLSSINDHNFEKFYNQDWTVYGSSDQNERPAGNEKLTNERINTFVKLIEATLSTHDFSQQLSADNVSKITTKKINTSYPTAGAERGVTYITDLVNSETGHNYTADDVAKIKTENPQEYQKLLAKCRYTNFEAEVVIEPEMIKLNNFDEGSIYFDDSGTMKNSKSAVIKDLQTLSKGENANKPMDIIFFSNGLDAIEKAKNSKEAIKIMSQDRPIGSDQEKVFTSLIQGLSRTAKSDVLKIKNGEKLPNRVAYLITDEGLQDANQIFKAVDLANKTNTTIILYMAYNSGAKKVEVNLNDLAGEFKNSIQKTLDRNKIDLEQSKIDQSRNVENLAFEVATKVSPKTLKEVLGQDKLGEKTEIIKLLVNGKIKLPDFKKDLDIRIARSIVNPLISAKDHLAKMDNLIDAAGKMTVEQYVSQTNIQINTVTDEEGNKVLLPVTDTGRISRTAQSPDEVKPVMVNL